MNSCSSWLFRNIEYSHSLRNFGNSREDLNTYKKQNVKNKKNRLFLAGLPYFLTLINPR